MRQVSPDQRHNIVGPAAILSVDMYRPSSPWKTWGMPKTAMANSVTEVPAAPSAIALAHFETLLGFETDCWDLHEAMARPDCDFVVLDVRSPELYSEGHIAGAVSLPHRRINERNLAEYPDDTLFVVYCAGPHCNGADKAAARLAALGRPVKKMIGGIVGWKNEGFPLDTDI